MSCPRATVTVCIFVFRDRLVPLGCGIEAPETGRLRAPTFVVLGTAREPPVCGAFLSGCGWVPRCAVQPLLF